MRAFPVNLAATAAFPESFVITKRIFRNPVDKKFLFYSLQFVVALRTTGKWFEQIPQLQALNHFV